MLMDQIIQCTIVGIMMGSVYALIAFGFTLIHGVVRVVNFSHGMFVLMGTFLAIIFNRTLGLDPYLSLFIILPMMFVIGAILEKIFVQPILTAARINQFILTCGLMIFLENSMLIIFGGDFKGVTTWYTSKSLFFGNISVNCSLLFAFICTILAFMLVLFILYKTRLGKAMRAVADDKEAAAMLGTNVWNVYTLSFGLAVVLAGIAGAATASYWIVVPSDGRPIVIKAFTVAIFGGAGNLLGTILGGLALGLLENLSILFINPALSSALSLAVMIGIILLRPTGILGKKQ